LPVGYSDSLYTASGATIATENLADVTRSLTPQEQESVRRFVEYLKQKGAAPSSPFLAAVDEFVDQHPELLRRLAQWPFTRLSMKWSALMRYWSRDSEARRAFALESALARPQSGYYPDVIQEAAALWESLSQNHHFVDGNKRVAVTVTAAFLRVNEYRLEFDDLETFSFLSSLYQTGTMRFAELDRWLRRHSTSPQQ
jgi:death on curing protein